MDVKAVVFKALQMISRGWCQHQFCEPDGDDWRYDLRGALVEAARGLNAVDSIAAAAKAVDEHIEAHTPFDDMVAYNDAPERTHQEVVQLLRDVYATL